MKIFIGWSGQLSGKLASILKQWLANVIQAVKPYYSEEDVAKGSRWHEGIAKELEDCRIGVICLTSENLNEPWIMFEAGALSKKVGESKVCPILFGLNVSDIKGPLAQFQAAKFTKSAISKVIAMMNAELGEKGLDASVLDDSFEKWWPDLESKVIKELQSKSGPQKIESRSERDILEEILQLTRQLVQESAANVFRPIKVDFSKGIDSIGSVTFPTSGFQFGIPTIQSNYPLTFDKSKEVKPESVSEKPEKKELKEE